MFLINIVPDFSQFLVIGGTSDGQNRTIQLIDMSSDTYRGGKSY